MYTDLDQDLVILDQCSAMYRLLLRNAGCYAARETEVAVVIDTRYPPQQQWTVSAAPQCSTTLPPPPQGRTGAHRRCERMFTAANVDVHHSSVR